MTDRLKIRPGGEIETGVYADCGRKSRKVWGDVRRGDETVATYCVHWTIGHVPETGAYFDLILRQQAERTTATDRWAVRLDYRIVDTGPGFMVIDAEDRGVREIVPLKREDVIGQPFAQDIFAICDAILVHDHRVEEILAGWTWSESPPQRGGLPPRRN